jgi:hypothetical protein
MKLLNDTDVILINICAFALLGVAAWFGYIETALEADVTYMVEGIAAVFAVGLVWCLRKIAHYSGRTGYGDLKRLELAVTNDLAPIRYIASTLVLLGLIGTVIGFIIALSGVDPSRAADLDAVTPMVARLIEGMSTALYTTLVGAIFNIWLTINYHLLAARARRYLAGAAIHD